MTVAERVRALLPFVEALEKHSTEIADLLTDEMGSPTWFSRLAHGQGGSSMAKAALGFADEFAWEARRGSSLVIREPLGVVGVITPWNVPQTTIMAKLVPALIAGCPVIVKAAPETPLDALLLGELFADTDLPAGVVAFLSGGTEAGQALVQHPGVDKIAFTGSTAVGQWIARECAGRLARVSLELGGKSAAIICPDAALERVVPGLKFASYMNNGQACVAQTRILAPRSTYEEVTSRLADMVAALVVGDPRDESTDIGPLVSARHRDRVHGYLETGVAEGATVVAGGPGPVEGQTGSYVRPTLFADVTNDMRVAREEIFGPVVVLIAYDDVDDAVRIANDSPYGLGGSVWTEDPAQGLDIARRVRTGTFGVNSYVPSTDVPFGGYKQSGIGREYGPEAFGAYVETKSVYNAPPQP